MSQNAILDRESAARPAEAAPFAEIVEERLPVTRAQRDHLMLLDWERSAPRIALGNQEWAPVRPIHRPWFGWYEACILLLIGGSGVAAIASLLHLG